jgi:hypothetical protein
LLKRHKKTIPGKKPNCRISIEFQCKMCISSIKLKAKFDLTSDQKEGQLRRVLINKELTIIFWPMITLCNNKQSRIKLLTKV